MTVLSAAVCSLGLQTVFSAERKQLLATKCSLESCDMADLDCGGLASAVGTQQAKALLLVDGQGQTSYCHLGTIATLALVHLHQ